MGIHRIPHTTVHTLSAIMRIFVLFACALVCMAQGPHKDQRWEDYKLEFDKHYASPEEEEKRYAVWKQAVAEIDLHNAQYEKTFEQEVNQFADMTDDEFEATYLTGYTPRPAYNLMNPHQWNPVMNQFLIQLIGDSKGWLLK